MGTGSIFAKKHTCEKRAEGVKRMTENKSGRTPKSRDEEELRGKIDGYFKKCEGEPLTDGDGYPILGKDGYPIMKKAKPPTVTGLALALGFKSRQSLLNYQAKPKFRDIITEAKSRVEEYTEGRLFDSSGANGAKFSLANNFEGWKEKTESAIVNDVSISVELTDE